MLTNIFKNPQVFNKEKHKNILISPHYDYSFSKNAYLVPLSVREFESAMKSYIIVFLKESDSYFIPAVVLGTKETKNLFLDENNHWKRKKYIPATIRSYPFGIGISNQKEDKFLALDIESSCVKDEGGYRLFNDELNLTQKGCDLISFVQRTYINIYDSKKFTKILKKYKLLKKAKLTIGINKEIYEMKNIYIIDELTLNSLKSKRFLKLAKKGFLKYIYAHIFSLSNKY